MVHSHETQEQEAELRQLAARLHAQYTAQLVDQLPCPLEQKQQLMDAVADTILKRSRT